LKRAKYLVCNIYDATLKIIAVAKVKANTVIHICSSIAWQAGARPVSQPPAPGLSSSRVADAIVEHIRLCNWKVERDRPWEGFSYLAQAPEAK
jgi:hypothetical protein